MDAFVVAPELVLIIRGRGHVVTRHGGRKRESERRFKYLVWGFGTCCAAYAVGDERTAMRARYLPPCRMSLR